MADSTPGHGFDPGVQPERTAEQLAAIHEAMMEELGISRKDELPLEDRGKNDLALASKSIKKPVVATGLASAWHNIQFDDLDPADDELDSIADGQLYRLRRGASYINQQKFGGRAGHVGRGGRGGRGAFNGNQQTFATRGGRGDRGFAATRGGHASPGRGGARVNRDNARSVQPPTPIALRTQTFFNDARRGVNSRLRVDEFLADLRAQVNRPRGKKAKTTPKVNSQNLPGPVEASTPQPRVQPPRGPRALVPIKFSLASAQDFLAHINPNDPRLPQRRPSGAASTTSRSSESTIKATTEKLTPSAPMSSMPVQLNNTKLVHTTNLQLSAPPVIPLSSAEAVSKPLTEVQQRTQSQQATARPVSIQSLPNGLAESRYADAPTSVQAAPLSRQTIRTNNENENPFIAVQNSGLSASKWAGANHPAVKREHGVRIRCNNDGDESGLARLFKQTNTEKFPVFELEVNGRIIVHAVINADVHFELNKDVVTYQAQGDASPIWQMLFRMPYLATNFYQLARPDSTLAKPKPSKIVGKDQPVSLSAAAHEGPGQPTLNTDIQSASGLSSTTTVQPSNTSMPPVGIGTSIAVAESEASLFISAQSNEHIEQHDIIMSNETSQPASKQQDELLFDFSPSSPESPRETEGSRISCQVYSQLTELEGVDPLISFSDHEDEGYQESEAARPMRPRTIQELLIDMQNKDDSEEIIGILAKLDNRPEGTFLQQVSAIVVGSGGVPSTQLTKEELLTSPPWSRLYNIAAQTVVSKFLSGSETFKGLPDIVSLVWMEDKSRKVLALAVKHDHSTDTTVTTGPSHDALALDPKHSTDTVVTNGSSHATQSNAIERSRIVIPIEELLSLRKYAFEIKVKLIDKKYMYIADQRPPSITNSTKPLAAVPVRMESSSAMLPKINGAPLVPQIIASKWQIVGRQKTDMEIWDTILNNDRKPQSTNAQSSLTEANGNTSTSTPRINGYVPTNSDYDRLAQKLEGWHMNVHSPDQQLQIELDSSETAGKMRNVASGAIDVEVAPPQRPSSSASKASTSASQSMTEKLTTALKSPLTFSPRLKTPFETVNTHPQAIEGQMDTVGIKKEEAGTLYRSRLLPQDALKSQASSSPVDEDRSAVQAVPVLLENDRTTIASEKFKPAPSLSEGNLGRSVSSTTSHAVAATSTLTRMAPENHVLDSGMAVSSSNAPSAIEKLRKGPGLSASRWASDDNESVNSQQSFFQSSTRSSHRLNPAHAPAFQPSVRPSQSHLNLTGSGPSFAPFGTVTAPPMIPSQSAYAPMIATVITKDPYTGELTETEGMLKVGSVPVVAHMPFPSVGPSRTQENVPMGMRPVLPTAFYNKEMPNFPPRPEHARHSSESSDSDAHFKPGIASNPLSPHAPRDHLTRAGGTRTALSPVQNRGNDLQSELQLRLSNSLAGRHRDNSSAY